MSISNITKVYLLDVPLENDYKNTLYFANATAQQTYFQGKVISSFSYNDFTYQRKDQIIRVPTHYDNIYKCNYVMYQNSAYSNKWFYAFVTDLEYINDGRTDLHIETDVIQTWLFDYQVKASFVEREHVSSDTVGQHTLPENVQLGEYIINSHSRVDELRNNLKLVIGSTVAPSDLIKLYGGNYNGIYSGVKYYTYSASDMTSNIQNMADDNKQDAISSLFLAPPFVLPQTGGGPIADSTAPQTIDTSVARITTLNGYTPRNNKLLTYPYCYILGSNGNGGSAIYHQEKFTNTNQSGAYVFRVYGSLTPGCSIRMIPINYNGSEINTDEGLNLGKYPQLNWATDMYTNWLTQNGVNVATSLVGSTAMTVASGMTGNALGVVGGVSGIANSLNEVYKASLIPPQTSGNINCGDVIASMHENTFHMYRMTIKQEYAQIIDKYFDMFGYKVNMVKVPNSNHRSRYWYTKTIDVNIDGDIPQSDMQKIKNAYNNGITFWKSASDIENYSTPNPIV